MIEVIYNPDEQSLIIYVNGKPAKGYYGNIAKQKYEALKNVRANFKKARELREQQKEKQNEN